LFYGFIIPTTVDVEIKPFTRLQQVGVDGSPIERRNGQMDHGGCSERLERLMFSICNATPALSGEECDGILIEWALRANQGGTADDASVLILGQVFLFSPNRIKKVRFYL